MAFSVDTVFLWVADLQRSLEWYRRFGLEPGPAYGDWQTMSSEGDTRFALHAGERPPGRSTAVVAFGVDNLDAELSRLAKVGIGPVDAAVTDTGVSRFTTFVDPDGNEVQLLERYQ